MEIITTTDHLAELCASLGNEPFITVDTEFMREKTYWAQLCLIQVAGRERAAIIDPLANGLQLDSFWTLMNNESVAKVFHAARQDVEIIHKLAGSVPTPLFDTQVAAMVCGFGDQVGYEALVRQLANAQIDKSSRFTDWSRRPLTNKQLAYALSDVTHLRVAYEKLRDQLDETGRADWVEEEMALLADPATYVVEPTSAYKRVKFRPRKKRQQAVLMALAEWREETAQTRNVPRNRVLKDDAIGELATQCPKDADSMDRLRAVPRGFGKSRYGEGAIKAIRRGMATDLETIDDLPQPKRNREGVSQIADILKLALKITAEEHDIAPRIIASAADVEKLAAGEDDTSKVLKGWRRKVFGETALGLRTGDLVVGLEDGKATILRREPKTQLHAAQ